MHRLGRSRVCFFLFICNARHPNKILGPSTPTSCSHGRPKGGLLATMADSRSRLGNKYRSTASTSLDSEPKKNQVQRGGRRGRPIPRVCTHVLLRLEKRGDDGVVGNRRHLELRLEKRQEGKKKRKTSRQDPEHGIGNRNATTRKV